MVSLATACPVRIAQIATTMKVTMAVTLIAANQNSASPKNFTLSMLRTKTRANAVMASDHWGIGWKNRQWCR